MSRMTSLERMFAAIRGEPFDMYPFVNPYPVWSMMPHWPDILGLNFLHLTYGTDSERLRCYGAFHEVLGLDWMPIPEGPTGQDRRYRVETECRQSSRPSDAAKIQFSHSGTIHGLMKRTTSASRYR